MSRGKYILPNFDILKPIYIEQSIKKIQKSPLFENDYEAKPSIDKYFIVKSKLLNKQTLKKSDYRVLSYHLDQVEKDNILNLFYKTFLKKAKKFSSVNSFIRPFLSYIYNHYDKNNALIIYKLLRIISKRVSLTKRYEEIKGNIQNYSKLTSYLDNVRNKLNSNSEEMEFRLTCRKLFLNNTDRFYYLCIQSFIAENHLNDTLWSFFKKAIETMELDLKVKVIEKILLKYKDNTNVESYPLQWFRLAFQELKDPFDPVNKRWAGMDDEAIEIYRRWNAYTNIHDFFENKIKGGDRRRLDFWKQYVNNIFRIHYFEDFNKGLVMEFRNHLFVEFAQHGNALYIYNKKFLDFDTIKSKADALIYSRSKGVNILKNKELKLKSLAHSHYWESNFEYEIKMLGYQKSRW